MNSTTYQIISAARGFSELNKAARTGRKAAEKVLLGLRFTGGPTSPGFFLSENGVRTLSAAIEVLRELEARTTNKNADSYVNDFYEDSKNN